MNDVYMRRMKEDELWFLKMSLIFGLVFTFCIYRNISGIMFTVLAAGLILFAVKFLRRAGVRVRKDSVWYFIGILLLGVSVCLTTNGFFHFFNCVGILLLFMAGMVHQFYDDREWGFAEYVKKFFILVGTCIASIGEPFKVKIRKKSADGQEKKTVNRNVRAVAAGIGAAVLFLIVVMPLLIMSDKIFSEFFYRLFGYFDLSYLVENVDIENIVGITITFFIGTVGIYAFFSAVFRMNLQGKEERRKGNVNPVTGITFTAILAVIYVFYSMIQIFCLFLRLGSGLPDGMTYSQYAHEGFWQLLFVSVINFAAVLICMQVFGDNRMLKILLCIISVCTCVMILSAAYRMMLYVGEYNLTFLRVLVLWFLAVLMLIFFGVIYSIFRRRFRLFKYIMLIVSVMYIGFSFSHVDQIIAGYNISNTESMNSEDVYYLMYGLSADAAPEIAKMSVDELKELGVLQDVDNYFYRIREDYGDMNARIWNFSGSAALDAAENWQEKTE